MHWKAKVATQFVLAHLPFGEQINHRLQRVQARRRGENHKQQRVVEIVASVASLAEYKAIKGATIVEVGTGWDALPTLALLGAGAFHIHTFDHQRHVRPDLLADAAARLAPFYSSSHCLEQAAATGAFDPCRVSYAAPADATQTGLPSQSVDVFYSYAVLEHVPEETIFALIAEAKRVLKPDGVFYALIGLHDHYNGFDPARVSKVNFLRYPEWAWKLLVKNNISYHNRLRERDFIDMLARAGASIAYRKGEVHQADLAEVQSMALAGRFAGYSPDELAVTRSELIACFGA